MSRLPDRSHPGMRPMLLEAVRATFGALQLLAPDLLTDRVLNRRLDSRARTVSRLLGARHLTQALASGRAPTTAVLALGAEVDLLHAVTSLALGIIDRRRRGVVALADAFVASTFAVAGVLVACVTRHAPPRQRSSSALGGMRDRFAARLATTLVPDLGVRIQQEMRMR
jgi:hypothetical protein